MMAIGAIGFCVWASLLWWRGSAVEAPVATAVKRPLPHTFAATPEALDSLGTGAFATERKPFEIELPDLSCELVFYGVNQRPDAVRETPIIHLGLKSDSDVMAAPVGAKTYLLFDREAATYTFSPANRPSNLWVTPELPQEEGEISVRVGMVTHEGEQVSRPKQHAALTLTFTPYAMRQRSAWMLGDLRVDNSLLARQRARWFGGDRFLAKHGGKEYSLANGRERIDFGEAPNVYTRFLALGESLIWKEGQWQQAPDGKTQGYPILYLRKADERLLVFDLWDEEGKGKIGLSLMKSRGGWGPTGGRGALRFVAAKTWSQLVLECGAQRVEVAPGDWLLFVDTGLHKLESLEEIDSYVTGALAGELLVIEGLERREGRQVLVTSVYNTSRSEVEEKLIALTSAATNPPPRPRIDVEIEEPTDLSLLDLPEVVRGLVEDGGN